MATKLYVLVAVVCCVTAQDYLEEKHKNNLQVQVGHLNEIPKRFEIKGANAKEEFDRYIHDIEDLAKRDNMTVKYKVKVETVKVKILTNKKRKTNSKKYNIPLKKRIMKLSTFEAMQRKMFDEKQRLAKRIVERVVTTQRQIKILTTKIPNHGKYKPIIGSVKVNYTKIIKPVKSKTITLTR